MRYILLGIILLLALILFLRAKIIITLDDGLTLRAGLGPVIFTLVPKKEKSKKRKKPRLSTFSYKKHMKRLERDAKAAARDEAKKAKKKHKKLAEKKDAVEEKAAETEKSAAGSIGEKLKGIFELISFILDEFPRLASYIHIDVRRLHVTVSSSDAAVTAEMYGGICIGVSGALELLACKTKLKKIKADAVRVYADFLGEKTDVRADIKMSISVFSALRVGVHTLAWFIKKKLKQS